MLAAAHPNHTVTPDSFRGPPGCEPKVEALVEQWMPKQVRHDGGNRIGCRQNSLLFPCSASVRVTGGPPRHC